MNSIRFYSFWFAKTSIALADVIYIMVITTYIYQKTDSALMSSLFPLFKALANLTAGLTSPLIYRKFAFAKLMVKFQGLKALLLTFLLLGFLPITNHIYVLLLFILVISFMEGWGNPLLNSVTPKIVSKENLVRANSSLSITTQSVQIAGYSFTGFAVINWGHNSTLAFNVVLLWLSVLALYITSKHFVSNMEVPVENKSKWALMNEGWKILWHNQTLRMVTLMDVIEGMAGSIWVGAITLVYVKEALNQGEQWWGFINASYYVGAILGGIITIFIAKTIQKHLIFSMAIGSLVFSIFTLIYGLTSSPILALLLCIAMGPAYQIRDVAQQTAFQINIQTIDLPKVFASQSILLSTVSGLSIFLIGFIADFVGIRAVYIFAAILIFISALLSFTLVKVNKKKFSTVDVK
ncbi:MULTISPECIES: MFS transporter [Niallia]|jgi:MFS family permease|uniref:MFS transporter n=3 Tax=Niallia circulans TaxID=1397 RepID=A0AA91TWR0_NIACI|nr:MFS transporter [Niallia circulans]AYV70978.1 MFS transporter [Niallia circulans]NRG29428.1 MFS transporter [Niallia circulans]PAD85339.1 MFS transporter [Niallia circulans]QJX62086.1 MFS transporter [Niallia circulans]